MRLPYLFFFTIIFCIQSSAQITPPGLGETNAAAWIAIGVKQQMNTSNSLISTTYAGIGRVSTPNNYNLMEKASIYVINEEISHQFLPHWKYSLAASYRWQDKYESFAPYSHATPYARQEIRLYGRYSYLSNTGNLSFSTTIRPELRFFYNPDFSAYSKNEQFRSRFREKMTWNLNSLKHQKLIATVEFLFAVNKDEKWEKFSYNDTRFCIFYSINPTENLTFDMGYMNDLIGKDFSKDVHYLSVDLILKNPFGSFTSSHYHS